MAGKAILGMFLAGVMLQGTALAGPYLGEWGWCWHPARDCAKGEYCPLHYWTPGLYKLRACFCPSQVEQYPPGPAGVTPSWQTTKYPCPSTPPMPTAPYVDPAAYFGRQIVP